MTTMTLEKLRFELACHLGDGDKPALQTMRRWLDNIDAHLAKVAQDARKAFAFDALVAAGLVTQDKADESLAIADGAMLSQRGKG